MATKSGQQEPEKAEVVEELLDALDTALDRVKVLYEQYFLGIQKQPPTFLHTDVERKIRDIAQIQVRNTALRYRFVTLQQKFGSYNAYWRRTLRQIENGTYTRNLSKIGRQAGRTGAAVPEEILAAMPKRMREQVQRDREAALALAALRDQQRADDPYMLTLAEEDIEIDLGDLEPAAFIQESSDLRRNVLTTSGSYRIADDDAEFDLDAFFASVTKEDEPDLETATPVFMPRMRTEPRALEDARWGRHSRPASISDAPSSLPASPLPGVGPPAGQPAEHERSPQPAEASSGALGTPSGLPALEAPSPASAPAAATVTTAWISPQPRQTPPKGTVTQALPRSPASIPSRATPPVAVRQPIPIAQQPPSADAEPSVVAAATTAVRPPAPAPVAIPAAPPSAARPVIPAPSQATRPSPVAPGASTAHAPTAVESLAGPFPRLPSLPGLPSKRPADPGAAPVGVERREASEPVRAIPAIPRILPARPAPPPVPRSSQTPPPLRAVPPVDRAAVAERLQASERTTALPRLPSNEHTAVPERMPASERPPVPERMPGSERTSNPGRMPASERPPVPERMPASERPVAPPPAASRGAPGPRQGPPPGMSDADVNALYATYIKAKETLGEDAGPGAYGKLLKTINAQAPKIMEQYKSKGVDFSVVVKDNQVVIRAKPKP